jgi:ribosome-binding factor A
MTGHRARRVQDLVREVLADLVRREVRDPRVGMVTVTAVRLSPDLRHARVFISSLGDAAAREASVVALNHAASYLRRALGKAVRLKYVPDLLFAEDTALETGQRVERLLDEIHDERASSDADGPDPDRDEDGGR